jgi:hypothetical protein
MASSDGSADEPSMDLTAMTNLCICFFVLLRGETDKADEEAEEVPQWAYWALRPCDGKPTRLGPRRRRASAYLRACLVELHLILIF